MARSPRLKVFRTPIGFHDAYVAAPSRKAALAAWGSDRDLFARGIAELVTDPALSAEPLAQPGVVIRKSRGSAAEQLAAAPPPPSRPPEKPKRQPDTAQPRRVTEKPPATPPPPPRPDRETLDEAEAAMTEAQARFDHEQRELSAQEALLARHRRQVERDHARELDRLTARRDRADRDYRIALADWRSHHDRQA
ncbi:hypothetical protein [Sphingomonas sp. 1P08PE]|uniref:hypothetical protein n=1 Tax=Sphingomonas sp. 1P08PE TaxID=554122 RepID=UPI0039A230B5